MIIPPSPPAGPARPRPASGSAKPAIISRNSCRAATWLRPTSSISLRSSRVRPFGKELAVDHPLAEPRNDPEADPARKLAQRLADPAHVARLDMLHPVPQHDPVDAGAVRLRPLRAAVPDQLGVEARPAHLEGLGVDLADQVEVDEAVVDRGDERVGADHRGAGIGVVAARRVDDHDLGLARDPRDRLAQALALMRIEGRIGRHRQRRAGPLHPSPRDCRDSGPASAAACRDRAPPLSAPAPPAPPRCAPRWWTCRCRLSRWRR